MNDFDLDEAYYPATPDPLTRPWLAKEHALRQQAEIARARWANFKLPVVDTMTERIAVYCGSVREIEELNHLSCAMVEAAAAWRQHIADWRAAGMPD